MSTEDKIAAIRREVEERAGLSARRYNLEMAHLARTGVVIYGVPLSEGEILELRGTVEASIALDMSFGNGPSGALLAIWEMLERGKK